MFFNRDQKLDMSCPITGKIFFDPVYIERSCRHYVERSALINWRKTNNTCPSCKQVIADICEPDAIFKEAFSSALTANPLLHHQRYIDPSLLETALINPNTNQDLLTKFTDLFEACPKLINARPDDISILLILSMHREGRLILSKSKKMRDNIDSKELNSQILKGDYKGGSALFWLTATPEGMKMLEDDKVLRDKITSEGLHAIVQGQPPEFGIYHDHIHKYLSAFFLLAATPRGQRLLIQDKALRDKITSASLNRIIPYLPFTNMSAVSFLLSTHVGRKLLIDNPELVSMITLECLNTSIMPMETDQETPVKYWLEKTKEGNDFLKSCPGLLQKTLTDKKIAADDKKQEQNILDKKNDQDTQKLVKLLDGVIQSFNKAYDNDVNELLSAIPANDMWRFVIDGRHQIFGLEWCDYDKKEPGYLDAMISAWIYMLDHFKKSGSLTLDFIKTLHETTLKEVKGTIPHGQRNEYDFNNTVGTTTIYPFYRMSAKKIESVLSKLRKGNPLISLHLPFSNLNVNYQNLDEMLTKKDDLYESAQDLLFTSCSIRQGKPNMELKDYQKIADDTFNRLIKEYNNNMKEAEKSLHPFKSYNKLKVIIEFIAECEQSHPYVDGNGRTFCFLLLNFLLLQNNFPPVILDNPNNFDFSDTNSLISDVIEGMRNALTLAQDKTLFNSSTSDRFSEKSKEQNNRSFLKMKYYLLASKKPHFFWELVAKVAVPDLHFEVPTHKK
jgi:hypothetical protein